MKKKIIIFIIFIIIWLFLIFSFSSMDFFSSNILSKNFIAIIVENFFKISHSDAIAVADVINMPVRKMAHMFEFAILETLILFIIKKILNKIDGKTILISILICFIFAILDEIHQLFVYGRNGQVIDVFIDITGCIIISICYFIFKKK